MPEPIYVDQGAEFSPCGTWRYRLWRYWQGGPGTCGLPIVWLLLNPSTADATKLDPTLRRCVNFARSWGYNGIEVLNLFALRSTDPKGLTKHPDPVGPDNDATLVSYAGGCFGPVIAGWGAHGARYQRAGLVLKMLQRSGARCLRLLGATRDGHPLHPLYLPGSLSFPEALVAWPEVEVGAG